MLSTFSIRTFNILILDHVSIFVISGSNTDDCFVSWECFFLPFCMSCIFWLKANILCRIVEIGGKLFYAWK